MFVFLGLGTWFWALAIIEFLLLIVFVDNEWAGASLISMAVFVILIWWLADVPIWTWIKTNPWFLLKCSVGYIICGIIWSFIKYYFALIDARKTIVQLRESWDSMHRDNTFMGPAKTFKEYIEGKTHLVYDQGVNPALNKTTRRLTFWASFWPISLIWTLINDPIRRLFKWLIQDVFINAYKQMYNNIIGKALED